MDDDVKGLTEYLEVFRRRKLQAVPPAIVIFVVGVVAAFVIPPTYKATATILIEEQEIPADLVRSTITTYANRRIKLLSKRVVTSANLLKLIEQFNLYAEAREAEGLGSVLNQMRDDIRLNMVNADVVDPRTGRTREATIAFTVSFQGGNPEEVQRVTDELASLYLMENLTSRTESVAVTTNFLGMEAKRLNAEVTRLERELSDYRSEHADHLPELTNVNMQKIDRAENQLMEVRRKLHSLEERKIYLRADLSKLQPNAILYSADGSQIMSPQDRLESLRAEYARLSARYTDSHPTLIAMRREMNSLRNAPANAAPLPSRKPDNPAYIQIQAQLHAAEIEQQSLKLAEAQILAGITELEGRIARAPLVERDLSRINRQYQNALRDYGEIRQKERAAELSETLERGRRAERLLLIEPPLLPETPIKPDRLAIVFLSFVFAMAGGAGTIALRESMDTTVCSSKNLADLFGEEPLSVIPFYRTRSERRARYWRRLGAAATVFCLVAVGVAHVHTSYESLDEFWYAVTQRLGIQTG